MVLSPPFCAQLCPILCQPRTVARQAPLSMEFSRQEYWCGLSCPPPGDIDEETEALRDSLTYLYCTRWHSNKEFSCQCKRYKRYVFDLWVGKIPWRRKWQPALVFLPEKVHGQRSLMGYSPCGWKELGPTEQLSTRAVKTRVLTQKLTFLPTKAVVLKLFMCQDHWKSFLKISSSKFWVEFYLYLMKSHLLG